MKKNTIIIESAVCNAGRDYLIKEGYVEMFPPRLVRASGACENIDTLFEVSVDGNPKWFMPRQKATRAYLAQTGQLYLEAYVPELKKVFCVGSSFRAEPEIDVRHLTEFGMMEIEFAGNFEMLLDVIQSYIYHIAQTIAAKADADPELFGFSSYTIERLYKCPQKFARLTYDQAIITLQKAREHIDWGDDISSAREKKLVEHVGNIPLFITHFPDPMVNHGKEIEVEKFFNMLPSADYPGRVLSADLILPFAGESVGAAARVHDPEIMVDRLQKSKMFARLQKKGGDISDFGWYINQIKIKGSIPHAGCGFGLARIFQWIHGTDDIRKVLTFPLNRGFLI